MLIDVSDARSLLSVLPPALAQLDVAGVDEAELRAVLAEVRSAQRALDGVVLRVGARAEVLAAGGFGVPVVETVRGGGAVSSRQAKREAERVKAVGAMPSLGDAVSSGVISGEHVDVVARQTAKLTDDQREQVDDSALMERAAAMPVETFERFLRREVTSIAADGGLADTVAKQAASELRHWFDHDTGMGKLFATLDPELYERVTSAIDRRMAAMARSAGEAKNHNLAARALGVLATGGHGRRPQIPAITVLVDYETFTGGPHRDTVCETEPGHDVALESVARMCCDATIRRVVFDEHGVPLNVGRKYRTASDGQWAALKAMHSTCSWDGCTSPISWCQAHHIDEWEHGGSTDLDNLVPLCRRHHHRVHEGRWRLRLLADRTLQIYRPDRRLYATVRTPMRCWTWLPRTGPLVPTSAWLWGSSIVSPRCSTEVFHSLLIQQTHRLNKLRS